MANSALVNISKPSSLSSSRGTSIDTITLMCVPNCFTCDEVATHLASHSLSCNYLIDYSGNIALSVDESRAAQCTTNSANNKRSISIAVSAERLAPYELSTISFNRLLFLLVDICERNNVTLKKLVWSSSSAYRINRTNGCNVIIASDFSGDSSYYTYLLSIAESVVNEANNQITRANLEAGSFDFDDSRPVSTNPSSPVSTASMVTKSMVISKDEYLSEKDQQINARYIWQYFGGLGWTLNAVAAMLGNIQRESTVNPGLKERPLSSWTESTKGYGLTQWTPASKLFTWCNERKLDYTDIDSQLKKIEDELNMHGKSWVEGRSQWINSSSFPISFKDFTVSEKDLDYLTEAFVRNYERPHSDEYTKLLTDYGNITGLQLRQKWAKEWYDFLLPFSNLNPPTAYGLQLLSVEADCATAMCYLQNVLTDFTLQLDVLDSSGRVVTSVTTDVVAMDEKALFKIANLKPNKEYSLRLLLNPSEADTEPEEIEESDAQITPLVSFITTEGRPKSVDNLQITALTLPLPDREFRIDIDPPENWGYWVKRNAATVKGYDIQLIINGRIIDTKTVPFTTSLRSIIVTPNDQKYFSKANVKPGDLLQIGVRAWVLTSSGTCLYDDTEAKTTPAICLINQKHRVFLTREN